MCYFSLRKAATGLKILWDGSFIKDPSDSRVQEMQLLNPSGDFLYDALAQQNLLDISRLSNSTFATDGNRSPRLSKGTEIGIAVGSVLALICLAFCAIYSIT